MQKSPSALSSFLLQLQTASSNDELIKINMGNYNGAEIELKKCLIKPILLKSGPKLSFTYRYQTKDITKNYEIPEGVEMIAAWLNSNNFRSANLFCLSQDYNLQWYEGKGWQLQKSKASITERATLSHDKVKERKIADLNQSYLHLLGLTNKEGKILKDSQDKYKQINHYIDLLAPALKNLPASNAIHIADMGAGKGYLTFALYDYLLNQQFSAPYITGVEYRKDLVDTCNQIATLSGFHQLNFVEGSIDAYQVKEKLDVLIALHACDTATDDAIFKGIQNQAKIIITAPCCHKQIRREMEKMKTINSISFLTQYGIFMERQAEMITDGIRALLLEYYGYKVKVMQFVSDAHTPKNIMILAEKTHSPNKEKQNKILEELTIIKKEFGIQSHYLESLLAI